MIKRISFNAFLLLLVILLTTLIHHKVVAKASSQTDFTSTTTFTIQSGKGNDLYDKNGKAVLKSKQTRGHNIIKLDASLNGRTAELPIGTLIFLRFPTGKHKISTNPAKGVVEEAKGTYYAPGGDIAILQVVGQGTAVITVTENKGSKKGVVSNSAYSNEIWSGYKQGGSEAYTNITSQWTVPTASSCSTLGYDTHSGTWLGIDDQEDALIQTGTASDCLSGNESYRAWWEILPDSATNLNTTDYPVSSGDKMYAEVKDNSTNFTIIIKNLTQNWTFTTDQIYAGSLSTVEWIVERPIVDGLVSNLTNYGSATFTNATVGKSFVNGKNPQFSYATDSENMTDDGTPDGTILSTPSAPNSLTDAFTAYYCDPTSGCPTANPPGNWNNNTPTGSTYDQIYSMAANSTTDVWTAGWEYSNGYPRIPATYHYNGIAWTKYMPPVQNYNTHTLYGVASNTSGDTWTVGSVYIYPNQRTLAYHWNNSTQTWSHVTSDSPSTNAVNTLNSVAIDGSGNVWAAGYYYGGGGYYPLIEKWNGTKFEKQTISMTGLSNVLLSSVTFNSSTNGWAVGYGYSTGQGKWCDVYYHYDGSSWTLQIGSITRGNMNSVTIVSDTEAWAIGSQGTGNSPLIMHYTSTNGWQQDTSFSSYPSGTFLKSVSGDSTNNVWIVGYSGNGAYTMHYNGSSWSQVSTPTISGSLLLGVTTNSGQAWAGGSIGNGSTPSPLTFKSL